MFIFCFPTHVEIGRGDLRSMAGHYKAWSCTKDSDFFQPDPWWILGPLSPFLFSHFERTIFTQYLPGLLTDFILLWQSSYEFHNWNKIWRDWDTEKFRYPTYHTYVAKVYSILLSLTKYIHFESLEAPIEALEHPKASIWQPHDTLPIIPFLHQQVK